MEAPRQDSTGRTLGVSGTGIRLGYLGDTTDWRIMSELYYRDKVVEAYDKSLEVGAIGGGSTLGFYRLIEGEALTRKQSVITDVTPWLKLEVHPQLSDSGLGEFTKNVCNSVAERLGWKFEANTMVSVLVPDADVPWHSARYGYMMDKYPYDKVCLPASALEDPHHFARVLAHEYAHVVTLNLTQNRAPHWVEEGISTLIEGPGDPRAKQRFETGESTWRDFRDLEAAFGAERRNGENRNLIRDAYDQARLLVEYLYSRKADPGLQQFLRAFTDNSTWEELKIKLGADPTDEALRQIYTLTQADLFREVRL